MFRQGLDPGVTPHEARPHPGASESGSSASIVLWQLHVRRSTVPSSPDFSFASIAGNRRGGPLMRARSCRSRRRAAGSRRPPAARLTPARAIRAGVVIRRQSLPQRTTAAAPARARARCRRPGRAVDPVRRAVQQRRLADRVLDRRGAPLEVVAQRVGAASSAAAGADSRAARPHGPRPGSAAPAPAASTTCSPTTKNVAVAPCSASISRISGRALGMGTVVEGERHRPARSAASRGGADSGSSGQRAQRCRAPARMRERVDASRHLHRAGGDHVSHFRHISAAPACSRSNFILMC